MKGHCRVRTRDLRPQRYGRARRCVQTQCISNIFSAFILIFLFYFYIFFLVLFIYKSYITINYKNIYIYVYYIKKKLPMLLLCVRCVVLCASIICVYVRVYVCIPLDILEHSCKKIGEGIRSEWGGHSKAFLIHHHRLQRMLGIPASLPWHRRTSL